MEEKPPRKPRDLADIDEKTREMQAPVDDSRELLEMRKAGLDNVSMVGGAEALPDQIQARDQVLQKFGVPQQRRTMAPGSQRRSNFCATSSPAQNRHTPRNFIASNGEPPPVGVSRTPEGDTTA